MPSFAIEESDYSIRGYKKIHAAGCKDLRDPEIVGKASTRGELLELLDGYGSAEDMDELDAYLSPCARKLLSK